METTKNYYLDLQGGRFRVELSEALWQKDLPQGPQFRVWRNEIGPIRLPIQADIDRILSLEPHPQAVLQAEGFPLLEGTFYAEKRDDGAWWGRLVGYEQSLSQHWSQTSLRSLPLPAVPYQASLPDGEDSIAAYLQRDSDTSLLAFPLVGYGNFPDANYTQGSRNGIAELSFQQVYPSFYLKPLLRAVAEGQGWLWQGAVWDDELFSRLLMPFTGPGAFRWNWGELGAVRFLIGGLGLPQVQSLRGLFRWIPTQPFYPYKLEMDLVLPSRFQLDYLVEADNTITSGVAEFEVVLRLWSQDRNELRREIITPWSVPFGEVETRTFTLAYQAEEGDVAEIELRMLSGPLTTVGVYQQVDLRYPDEPALFDVATNLPNLSQGELIEALCQLFGQELVFEPESKRIHWQPLPTEYRPLAEAEALPQAKVWGVEAESPEPWQRAYRYRSDSRDALLSRLPPVWDYEQPGPLPRADGAPYVLPFAATAQRPYRIRAHSGLPEVEVELPCLASAADLAQAPNTVRRETVSYVPRLLAYTGPLEVNGTPWTIRVNGATTPIGTATFPQELYWENRLAGTRPQPWRKKAQWKGALKPEQLARMCSLGWVRYQNQDWKIFSCRWAAHETELVLLGV